MYHLMIDSYGVTKTKLDDMKFIYELLNKVAAYNNLRTIAPPILIPYYYGDYDKEESILENKDLSISADSGISAYLFLDGGHATIHTFSDWGCYYFDIMYNGYKRDKNIVDLLNKEFNCLNQSVYDCDRTSSNYDRLRMGIERCKDIDFGPHFMMEKEITEFKGMDWVYEFLDALPYKLDMNPIARPQVITNKISNPTFVSGITLIAESHISVHVDLKRNKLYMDAFSCKSFDVKNLYDKIEEEIGEIGNYAIYPRGKETDKEKRLGLLRQTESSRWRENI